MSETVTAASTMVEPVTTPDRPPLRRRLGARRRRAERRCLRAICTVLGVRWQFDVTLLVDADVVAHDGVYAGQLLRDYLARRSTRIVVGRPGNADEPESRRAVVMTDFLEVGIVNASSQDGENGVWKAAATVTASFALPIRDAADDLDFAIDPLPRYPQPLERLHCSPTAIKIRRKPVRRPAGKHRR